MKNRDSATEQKLDAIIDLLKHLVALQLAQSGVKQTVIAKHIRVATARLANCWGVKRAND